MNNVSWIHTADLHLGKPNDHLKGDSSTYRQRQKEYQLTFCRIIETVQLHQIPILLIAGDFLEHGYVSRSLFEFVQEQLSLIPDTQVFIAPGNHDPYRMDSCYQKEKWPDHVHIFSNRWEEVYLEKFDIHIVGRGFSDFYEKKPSLPPVIAKKNKQIMLTHGDLLFEMKKSSDYFPLYMEELKKLNFDYIALGHIHKAASYQLKNPRQTLVRYPGSPEALSWKEIGKRTITWVRESAHGWIVEELPIQTRTYDSVSFSISGYTTKEQIRNKILKQELLEQQEGYTTIELQGLASTELDMDELISWLSEELTIERKGVFFVENHTLPSFDLGQLRKESQIVAEYITLLEEKQRQARGEEQELVQQALYKGLEAFVRKGQLR